MKRIAGTLRHADAGRARYVDGIAKGDPAIIHKAAMETTADKAPIGALPAPENLRVSYNGHSGQFRLRCSPVKGAASYVGECREHGPGAPGPWQQVKVSTSASFTVTGLDPGKEYAFRMKAVGAAGDSPWSDEAVKMAV